MRELEPPTVEDELPAIRALYDELQARIERSVTHAGSRRIALRFLCKARTHTVIGTGRRA